jgi:hypothetical protein
MLSDAHPDHVDVLEEFGDALGMAYQLSDDIMDITSSQIELGKEPGQDLREGVYTLSVLHALAHDEHQEELARILSHGSPDGRCSTGCSRSCDQEFGRRRGSPSPTESGGPPGSPNGCRRTRAALIQLAKFLAVRCGRRPREGRNPCEVAEGAARIRAPEPSTVMSDYYASYGVVLAVLVAGAVGRRGVHDGVVGGPEQAQPRSC